jgi:superfamily II DNA helicase RecQ
VSEPETVERVRGPRARLNGRAADRAFEALKVWRNQIGQDAGQTSAVSIASNNTLRNIAKARPFDLTELREVPEVRAWQVRDFGPQLLAVLDEIAPAGELDAQNADDAPSKSSRRRRR